MSNTLISYLYRDESNHKQYATIIVAGRITFEQVRPYLNENEWFIPSQVGLEDLQERWGRIDPDLDHVWHEFFDDTFEVTELPPTEEMTAEELLKRFQAVKWDEETPYKELMAAARYEDEFYGKESV
jgi:hypothetical protein